MGWSCKCDECGRVFDLLDELQAGEFYYGHDCDDSQNDRGAAGDVTTVRGFAVSLQPGTNRVVWCSDWATLTGEHARGYLGDAVTCFHHGPDTYGAVSYVFSHGATCAACVSSCDVVDAVIRPYGGGELSVLFVQWDVMGDSRSFVPVCETCADWHDQNVTLELGGMRS